MQPPYSCLKASAPRRLGESWRNGRPVIISRHRLIRLIFSVSQGSPEAPPSRWESFLPATHLPRLPFLIQFSLCRPFAFTVHVTVQIRKNEDYHLSLNRIPPPRTKM